MTIVVNTIAGDVCRVGADVLIHTIGSTGERNDSIDRAIMQSAGPKFHAQLWSEPCLEDGQAIVARGDDIEENKAAFSHVVFVVDDLLEPLRTIIFNGLVAAAEEGFESVTCAPIDLMAKARKCSRTFDEAAHEIGCGLREFYSQYPDSSIRSITFVASSYSHMLELLESALTLH